MSLGYGRHGVYFARCATGLCSVADARLPQPRRHVGRDTALAAWRSESGRESGRTPHSRGASGVCFSNNYDAV